MKTIQIDDPPMCCSTGICGTDMDPDLVNFVATHGVNSIATTWASSRWR